VQDLIVERNSASQKAHNTGNRTQCIENRSGEFSERVKIKTVDDVVNQPGDSENT
jgi:hypothetical protein